MNELVDDQTTARASDECHLSDRDFDRFRQLIYAQAGIALSEAKRHLVQSRLRKRLRQHQIVDFGAYYDLLTAQSPDSDEMREFVNCITTNKTDFFREAHHFDYVADQIVAPLREKVRRGLSRPRLRVWHAGCSTGEEPYTLAVTLSEALADEPVAWDIRLLATDIDTNVLAHAERGVYDRDRTGPIPDPLLRRHFLRGTGARSDQVRVRPELRQMITFRQINLLHDPWPIRDDARFDIIFCRNVVIYFDKPTQQVLFDRFARRLLPGGHLFIGHSESLWGVSDVFENLGRTIYRLPAETEMKAA